jgi:hypothetical protein
MDNLNKLLPALLLAVILAWAETAGAGNGSSTGTFQNSDNAVQSTATAGDELPMLINHGIDGSWVNSAANSQGLVIETMPSTNTLVAFWFTFNEAGGEREWFIALGDISGAMAELAVFNVEDGVFDQDSATQEVQWGTARIEFSDCTNAHFTYDSSLQDISGNFPLQRLTQDVSCADSYEAAHSTFVTRTNSWLDAQGTWEFDLCVELGPNESHGREDFRFDGDTMYFDMYHYNAAGCQGPVDVRRMVFELTRVDKAMASLGSAQVIANRVLVRDMNGGELQKQLLYFDVSVNPPIMTHGNFDAELDADGYPATLYELFASPQQP